MRLQTGRRPHRKRDIPMTANTTIPKRILDIRSAPGRHWVGDGLPVHNLFGYNGPGVAERSPFLMLAEEVPEAREHMGRFALAMAQQSDGSLVLLATERNLLTLNRASAEEIQDHRCAILNANH